MKSAARRAGCLSNTRTRSITCSMLRPVVSTTIASGAAARGACWRVRVILVPAPHILDHLLELHLLAARLALKVAAPGAFRQAGVQVNLEIGVRQDHGADVAPDHHDATALADAPLLEAHRLAHAAIRRHRRHGLLDSRAGGCPRRCPRRRPAPSRRDRLRSSAAAPRSHLLGQRGHRRLIGDGNTTASATAATARYITPVSK